MKNISSDYSKALQPKYSKEVFEVNEGNTSNSIQLPHLDNAIEGERVFQSEKKQFTNALDSLQLNKRGNVQHSPKFLSEIVPLGTSVIEKSRDEQCNIDSPVNLEEDLAKIYQPNVSHD